MTLRQTQLETLEAIAHSPDRAVWVSDIAQWFQRDIRSAQQRLERLEGLGLVYRGTFPWDGGSVEVWRLTDEGQRVLAA